MTISTPDDYYEALGVARDAPAAAIKTAYRKLVLKHHPDKVGDDADKTAAADRFHKIQTAWETIGDEEKRSRYDAQVRLATLRREKELAERERYSTPDYRPSAYRTTTDLRPSPQPVSPRGPPQRAYSYRAVEVKPPFDAENFDRLRTSERKDFDYEHDRRRRTSPRDDRRRPKLSTSDSRETERAKYREKGRQSTKATARDRDMKYSSYSRPEVVSDSDSDQYFDKRSPRDLREETRIREQHLEAAQEEARRNRYMHENTQKMFSDAQDYQQRMRSGRGHTESRRPSPTRLTSPRDQFEYGKTADGRPATVRRGSLKPPRTSSRDEADVLRNARRGSERDAGRLSNDDEPPRRIPVLNQTKSAPNDIRIPVEKQRSNSVQHHANAANDFIPPPTRRADSMPHTVSRERSKTARASTLRHTQTTDDYDSRRSPTRSYPQVSRSPRDYSDEHESPTRDPYRTEVREPVGRRLTRSPSPMRGSEKPRSSSNRYPAQPPALGRTTSTTYAYPAQAGAESMTSRPKLSRGDSSRKLFGEVPTMRSSRDRDPYSAPPADNIRVREMRPDVKVATGYTSSGRRPSNSRSPSYYKPNSYNSPTVSA